MKALDKDDHPATKFTKSILLLAMCLLLMATQARADFSIFLQNKLGDDRAVTYLFSEMTTDAGDVYGNPGYLASPLAPGKLLRLGRNITSDSLTLFNLMVIEYQCIENPNGTDCWSYDPDFLSFPNGPLSCEFLQDIVIDTSDKLVSGSGPLGQGIFETRQVRIVLNSDFTVTYRVIRKNEITGTFSRTEENITVANSGVACRLANL